MDCKILGDGEKGLVDVRIVQTEGFESESFVMARREGGREGDRRKVVEDDGRESCRERSDVWSC